MYKNVIEAVTNRINDTVAAIKYVSDDWGQLSYYGTDHPVRYPAALVHIPTAAYSNIGHLLQIADTTIVVTIAHQRLTNTHVRATPNMQQAAWQGYDIVSAVVAALHGYKPTAQCAAMVRRSQRQIKREDGIMQFEITFTCSITDDVAMPVITQKGQAGLDLVVGRQQ